MSIPDADVIVAGAGPAGAIVAYQLLKHGISTIILEKETFPRYKVCGGGLTHKILGELPFPVEEIIESSIYTVRFSHNFQHTFSRTSSDPVIYCTMRDRLDAFLLEKAKEAGAKILFDEQATGIQQNKSIAEVITKKNHYNAQLVIGAEGASRTVARSVDLCKNISMGLAWEAEIMADPEDIEKYSQTAFLDWGTFPGGYGWVFPKKDHFSIGVGGPASLSARMMDYYDQFTRSTGIRFLETKSLKSWPIPVRIRESQFHNGRVLIIGDAAGLTDPMTGEGIFYAVKSAKIAAETCSEYFRGKISSLESYTERINTEIMPELIEAGRIKYIFNAAPLRIHELVRENDRVWGGFVKILRGERNYLDVRKGFGKWKILWNPLATILKYSRKWNGFHYNGNGMK
jgi:geranylgeranyl reductase family protein